MFNKGAIMSYEKTCVETHPRYKHKTMGRKYRCYREKDCVHVRVSLSLVKQRRQLCLLHSPRPTRRHSIPIRHLLFYGACRWNQEPALPTHTHSYFLYFLTFPRA